MYRYSDNNKNNDISLHDCRAKKLVLGDGYISFVFDDGFYVTETNENNYNKKLSYTDKSEVVFRTRYDDSITIYVFSDTEEKGKSVREQITQTHLSKMLDNGTELEFLYEYKGYQSYVFECWLWFDSEPYHKECVIIISSDDVSYNWNSLYTEE